MGEEERTKLSNDVLSLARAVLRLSLQLKGTVGFFCNETPRMLFLEFLYRWLGYNPGCLLCIYGQALVTSCRFDLLGVPGTPHPIPVDGVCHGKAALTWPPVIVAALQKQPTLWFVNAASRALQSCGEALWAQTLARVHCGLFYHH